MTPVAMPPYRALLQLARPQHYVKNGFVWLPVFFGYKMLDLAALWSTWWTFATFCLLASSVYVANDLRDLEEDRRHPVKCRRPLASGVVSPRQALVFLALLLASAGILALAFLAPQVWGILGLYLLLNLAYSFLLKHLAIVDVVIIALGFVLRVYAGGLAAQVPVSHWIVTMTFLLAVFLALAKRRDDLLLASQGHHTRKSIDGYSLEFVSTGMAVMASVIIVAYLLYTMSPETIRKHGTDQLYLTGFWVVVGLLRFLQITFVEQESGSPTGLIVKDLFLQVVVILWMVSFFLLSYFGSL